MNSSAAKINFSNNALSIPDMNIIERHRFKSNDVEVALVQITPKLAEYMLNFLPENQRTVKDKLLSHLCSDIQNGWWSKSNGETIKFNKEGLLIDGQHRVRAVFRTGVPIESLVVFGCDSNGIETIDAGQNRSLSDVFKIFGFDNYTHISAMTSMIMQYEKLGYICSWTPSRKSALTFARQNNSSLQESHKKSNKAKTWLPLSMAGYLHFIYSRVNPELTDKMFNEFQKPKNDRGCSIQLLKDVMARLQKASVGKQFQNSRYWKNAIVIKAFNAYFLCQDISILRYSRTEKYPRIVETWID